jgi:RimJ/RimL family protein N-acetyltransferase
MATVPEASGGLVSASEEGDNHIRIRDVVVDDLPVFYEHQRDPVAARMAAFAPRDRDAFVQHWTANILGDPAVDKKTVVVDGRVAGNVVSFEREGLREVGYWIGREFWGKGVATGALRQFLEEVTTRPLHARVARANVASLRVLDKCGFTIVGEDHGLPDDPEDVAEFLLVLADA